MKRLVLVAFLISGGTAYAGHSYLYRIANKTDGKTVTLYTVGWYKGEPFPLRNIGTRIRNTKLVAKSLAGLVAKKIAGKSESGSTVKIVVSDTSAVVGVSDTELASWILYDKDWKIWNYATDTVLFNKQAHANPTTYVNLAVKGSQNSGYHLEFSNTVPIGGDIAKQVKEAAKGIGSKLKGAASRIKDILNLQ